MLTMPGAGLIFLPELLLHLLVLCEVQVCHYYSHDTRRPQKLREKGKLEGLDSIWEVMVKRKKEKSPSVQVKCLVFLSQISNIIFLLTLSWNKVTQSVHCRTSTPKSLPPKFQQIKNQQFRNNTYFF